MSEADVTERLRRRAAELEALYSTARELVRLRDVDEVLDRLVERAHQLMGTDVTYLSEAEAGGGLRVRHSAGTVTAEFRDLRVPAGFGLAAKVADTRDPAWVADYATMSDAPHDPLIDAAVAAEGLVSFLGVPLAVGDEVLGALFACNRFVHDFTPDQVLLLSAFADHAASVLYSARLLAERTAATRRAEEAYRELQDHLAATELASAIHDELTAAVVSGGTVVDLVATLSRRLGRRVWALDEGGRPLQVRAGAGGDLPPRGVLADVVARSSSSGQAEVVAADGRQWLVATIVGAERVLGAIVAESAGDAGDGGAVDDVGRRTVERAAQVAALVSFKRDAVSAVRADRRARLLLDLVDGRDAGDLDGDPQLALTGALSGCAVLEVPEAQVARAASLAADAAGDDGLVGHRDRRVIVAWGAVDAASATERMRGILAAALRVPHLNAVVVTGRAIADLGRDVDRATRDLRFLAPLGVTGTTVSSDAFAPYHGLSSAEPEAAGRFVNDLLEPVLTWDDRRGTALLDTLAAYFDAAESPRGAAVALHVHANTVQQRLDRIQSLLAGEWGDPEYRFRVQAAVRLERLRRSVSAAAVRVT